MAEPHIETTAGGAPPENVTLTNQPHMETRAEGADPIKVQPAEASHAETSALPSGADLDKVTAEQAITIAGQDSELQAAYEDISDLRAELDSANTLVASQARTIVNLKAELAARPVAPAPGPVI